MLQGALTAALALAGFIAVRHGSSGEDRAVFERHPSPAPTLCSTVDPFTLPPSNSFVYLVGSTANEALLLESLRGETTVRSASNERFRDSIVVVADAPEVAESVLAAVTGLPGGTVTVVDLRSNNLLDVGR